MPSHKHNLQYAQAQGGGEGLLGGSSPALRDRFIADAGGSGSHTHDFTGSTRNSNNLPPYYVLAHIMRLA